MVIPPNPSQPDSHDIGAFAARAYRRTTSGPTRDLHCAIPAELTKWLRREEPSGKLPSLSWLSRL